MQLLNWNSNISHHFFPSTKISPSVKAAGTCSKSPPQWHRWSERWGVRPPVRSHHVFLGTIEEPRDSERLTLPRPVTVGFRRAIWSQRRIRWAAERRRGLHLICSRQGHRWRGMRVITSRCGGIWSTDAQPRQWPLCVTWHSTYRRIHTLWANAWQPCCPGSTWLNNTLW